MINYKTKPRKYQKFIVENHIDIPRHGIFVAPRLGKTKTVIDSAGEWFRRGHINGVFVACSGQGRDEWEKQIAIHSPYKTKVFVYDRARELREQKFASWLVDLKPDELAFFIVQRESLSLLRGKPSRAVECSVYFANARKFAFTLDESHRVRNFASKTFQVLSHIANEAKYVRILTGTLETNAPRGVYTQLRFLSDTPLDLKNYSEFKRRYEDISHAEFFGHKTRYVTPKYRNKEELFSRIENELGVIINRIDVEELPDITSEVIDVHMSDEKAKLYRNLCDRHKSERIESSAFITSYICYSSGYDPSNNSVAFDPPKLGHILDIAEQWEGMSLVFYTNFRVECMSISESLKEAGYDNECVHGGVPNRERQERLERFKEGETPILVANVQCVGDSVGLHISNCIVWCSPTLDNTIYRQAQDRCSAVGKKEIHQIHLLTAGTWDIFAHNVMVKKASIGDLLPTTEELLDSIDL